MTTTLTGTHQPAYRTGYANGLEILAEGTPAEIAERRAYVEAFVNAGTGTAHDRGYLDALDGYPMVH